MLTKRIERIVLIALDAFLAVTALAGGVGLLTGAISPALEELKGSPFSSYTIPGLALMLLVGGSASAAMLLVLRRHIAGALASVAAGVMIMAFEIVEVLVVGSDPGLARNLQIFYFTHGLLIAALATWLWAGEHAVRPSRGQHANVH